MSMICCWKRPAINHRPCCACRTCLLPARLILTHTPGALLGLRLSTRRCEILRALLDGVTLEMRLNLEILDKAGCPIHELRVIVGGSTSRAWNRLKADVINKPVT